MTATELFTRHFLPLYPDGRPEAIARGRTIDANPAGNSRLLLPLSDAADAFQHLAPGALSAPDLVLDGSDASVQRLSAAVLAARMAGRLDTRAASAGEWPHATPSAFAQLVIHGVAYLGRCVVTNHGGRWALRNPLWDSLVDLHSAAGDAQLPLLSWWLRACADEDAEADLASRYRTYVQVPCFDASQLPTLADPSRRLPKLSKVRYDLLYKHVKAHLPELSDLGAAFPSPERFAAYEFKWLDFLWLGDGKMVLFFGLGKGGLHLFWLSRNGFEKAAHVPCESFPEPLVKVSGPKLVLVYSQEQKLVSYEMLWWGL